MSMVLFLRFVGSSCLVLLSLTSLGGCASQVGRTEGAVSLADYETAVRATVQCMRDQGVPISEGPTFNDVDSSFEFVYGPMAREDLLEEADEVYDACAQEFSDEIERGWYAQHAHSQKEVEEYEAAMRACLEAEGLDIPQDASDGEAIGIAAGKDSSLVVSCQATVEP